ncbi:alpha/beta fold hydrolase [Sphingomonas sp. ST-64]|uniref:Alpha/beta fold hydrolase n=1 Tax=Sphingomonas plantiphila TaxID=3163295 RepID=A0ABW8YKP6_9SPHN
MPAQQYEGFTSPPEFVLDIGPDGYAYVKPNTFKAGFAADTRDADAAYMRDSQVPIAMAAFGTTLRHAAWRTKPSWAVIATDDRAFQIGMPPKMAKRIGATRIEVKASHGVFMTQPKALADVIDTVAGQVSAKRD